MFRPTSLVLLLAALAVTPACRSFRGQYHLGADDYVLATRTEPSGATTSWRLQTGTVTSLVAVTEREEEQPLLGLRVAELDKDHAEKRGVRPYTGLLVRGVADASSAAEAGVLVGDVLLAIDGGETFYLPQLRKVEAALRVGQKVVVKVLRGQDALDLDLTVRATKQKVRDEQAIALESPKPLARPFAGVTLVGIPAAHCERIFGAPRQAVIVSQVEVGSPAWVAGIRPGDVIDTLDGQPVPDVHGLQRTIAERGESGESITLGVHRGADGAHEGQVALSDYQDATRVRIPLVFCLDNGVWRDSWSFGPWGLLLRNRNSYVADATTRRVKTHNVFSAVLGLFRVESTPTDTSVRLLWFIRFDT